ncbi:beta-ketoacyl-ACP synthase III [Enterococcus nangangensis]|uniref:beta-ketoacyl-ACP synthase III n=1 Tax=Enterococcus nangangensis TaxID=2559926 RepID=UPI0010F93961|nr:beta-ketoacyl-ACP synthase III [Enterococcus nangangensis]
MTRIVKTASYLPKKVVTNFDLAQTLTTSDEWIVSRTGIKERRIAESTTSQLALKVAEQLVTPELAKELDFIIVATFTPEEGTPSVACKVQGALGATKALAFDLNAACSGFVYALSVANALLQGQYHKGLVIGAEVISKIVDWQDRTTAILFGDGAGGVLLEKSATQQFHGEVLGADGMRGAKLTAGFWGTEQKLTMDGRAIFDFVMHEVKNNLKELAAKTACPLEKVDYFLLHQANQRLLDQLAKKLQLPPGKFLSNLAQTGNTSAASIPILLDQAVACGTLQLGSKQKVIFTGFGAGLTYGSVLVTL